MTVTELLSKRRFHDSTLESIRFLNERSVELVVNVCLWMQEDYANTGEETQIQRFIFEEVAFVEFDGYDMEGDTILEARAPDERTLELALLHEPDGSCHIARIGSTCGHISAP